MKVNACKKGQEVASLVAQKFTKTGQNKGSFSFVEL